MSISEIREQNSFISVSCYERLENNFYFESSPNDNSFLVIQNEKTSDIIIPNVEDEIAIIHHKKPNDNKKKKSVYYVPIIIDEQDEVTLLSKNQYQYHKTENIPFYNIIVSEHLHTKLRNFIVSKRFAESKYVLIQEDESMSM